MKLNVGNKGVVNHKGAVSKIKPFHALIAQILAIISKQLIAYERRKAKPHQRKKYRTKGSFGTKNLFLEQPKSNVTECLGKSDDQ